MRGVGTGIMRGGQSPREIEFSFNSLPDVIIYIDPAYSETIELNAADVKGITGRDPSAHVWSQDTAADQPLYDTTGINGQNTIDWERADSQFMESDASVTHSIGTGDFYLACLVNLESIADIQILFSAGATDDWHFFTSGAFPASQRVPTIQMSSNIVFDSILPAVSTNYVLEFWRDGTSVRCRLNNTLDTDSRTSSFDMGTGTTMRLGDSSFTQHFDGRAGILLLCSSLPNSDQRAAARRKAAAKWGI